MSRITTSMLSTNYLRNVNRNLNYIQTVQNQLSTGKKISKPSDDPYAASRIVQMYADISGNEQYNDNITDVTNFLDVTDTSINQISNLYSRVRELLVQAGNAAYGSEQLQSIQDEMKVKVDQLAQLLNTSFDGKYIFGGTKIDSKPVTVVDGKLQYADADGNAIRVYKDFNGEYTTSDTSNNTAVSNLNTIPKVEDKLKSELASLNLSEEALTTEQIARKAELEDMLSGSNIYVDAAGNYTSNSTGTTEVHLNSDAGTETIRATLENELNGLNLIDESELTSDQVSRKTELTGMLETPATTNVYVTPTGQYTSKETSNNTQISIAKMDRNEIQNKINSLTTEDPIANAAKIEELNKIKQGIIYYNQSNAGLKIEISQGVSINYNQKATDILEFTDPDDPTRTINVSDLFSDIIKNLNSEDGKIELTGNNLKDLDKAISNLLTKSSEVGAMQNRMESAETQNETENYNLTSILSSTEDIDFTETMIDFSTLMTVYKASLQISANILPQTIMDYL